MATEPLPAMRECRKCGVEKPHDDQHFVLKLGKLTPLCRACNAADCKRRYEANREERKRDNRERWHANNERYRETQRRYYREHIEERRIADKQYREANPERRAENNRAWRAKNPERVAEHYRAFDQSPAGKESRKRRSKRWLERHGDRIRADRRVKYYQNHQAVLAYQRAYYSENRERFLEQSRRWYHENKATVKAWDHIRRAATNTGAVFTKHDVEMIFAEQGGCCSYCGGVVCDRYEVDHFIPIAKGGGNEPENILIACMPCNRSKGAKQPWDWRPDLFKHPSLLGECRGNGRHYLQTFSTVGFGDGCV